MKNIFITLFLLASFTLSSQNLIDTMVYDQGSSTNYTYYDENGNNAFHYTVVPPAPEEQIYKDYFPKGKRAPWGYRIYEKWQMQQIHHIDIIDVEKYMRVMWRRGLYPFYGDTTKLVHVGWRRNGPLDLSNPISNLAWKVYELRDTIYAVPTPEGFELWKKMDPKPIAK